MASRILKYRNGDEIIQQGATEQRMYIILEGKVKITITDDLKRVELAVLGKKDFFGEISLFGECKRSASATAVGNVKLTYIDSEKELDAFLMKNPGFSRKMAKVLCSRLAKTNDLLKDELSGRSNAAMIGFLWD